MATVKRKRGRPSKAVTRADVLQIRLEPLEKKAFTDAAMLSGLGVSAWVRERLRRAAMKELEDAAMPIAFLKRGL